MTRLLGLLISFLTALNLFADSLDTWTWRNPLPTGNALRSVAYGTGQFVAVGEVGTVLVSPDAANWIVHPTPTGNLLSAIAYGNGRFVAVGNADPFRPAATIIVSSDTTNWISASPATTNTLFAVAFGSGTFIAVGENETIISSTDGTNWVKRHETPLGNRYIEVAYGNGLFMTVATGSGSVLTSPDGATWSPQPGFGSGFRSVTFGNGVFVAENIYYAGAALIPRIVTSAEGNSWSTSLLPPPNSATFAYDTTQFVLVGFDYYWQSNIVYTSANGLNWSTPNFIAALPNGFLRALAFGGGEYVGISTRIVHSTNLLQWQTVGSSLPISTARVFLQGNGVSVIAGTGPILVSSNGLNYETNATTGDFGMGAFGTNTFTITSGGGSVVTSSNGVSWTARNTGGTSINGLTYGSNQFVAVGNSGDIRTSPNGAAWSGRFSGTSLDLLAIAYGNGLYVAAGGTGAILTSPDGVNWSFQDSGTTATFDAVAFGNGIFFAAGRKGVGTQIRISVDGVTWTPTYSSSFGYSTVCAAVRGNLIVVSSLNSTVDDPLILSSIDGLSWRSHRVPFSGPAVCGTTSNTLILLGFNARIAESGALSPIGLFTPAYHPLNGFSLRATGDTGATSRLQKSTNLIHWMDVKTFTNVPPWTPVTDPAATNTPSGFYRVVAP